MATNGNGEKNPSHGAEKETRQNPLTPNSARGILRQNDIDLIFGYEEEELPDSIPHEPPFDEEEPIARTGSPELVFLDEPAPEDGGEPRKEILRTSPPAGKSGARSSGKKRVKKDPKPVTKGKEPGKNTPVPPSKRKKNRNKSSAPLPRPEKRKGIPAPLLESIQNGKGHPAPVNPQNSEDNLLSATAQHSKDNLLPATAQHSKNNLLPATAQSGANSRAAFPALFGRRKTAPVSRGAESAGSAPAAKNRRGLRLLRRIALVAAIAVFIWSFFDVASRLVGYRKARNVYDGMRKIFYDGADGGDIIRAAAPVLPDSPTIDLYTALGEEYAGKRLYKRESRNELITLLPKFERLKKINRDFFGWIKVSGTQIDYPVVKGGDNEHYLTHAFDGSALRSGTIYADNRNKLRLGENRNTVFYGHNMKDGSMFAALTEFQTESVFQSGRIKLYTGDGIFEFTPFSVYTADPEYPFFRTDFTDSGDFMDFLNEMKSQSLFFSPVALGPEDLIVTLMTCTNTLDDRRLVLQAVLTSRTE